MLKNADKTMEKIVALCKNRGFVFAGSEIYGGLANTWDYGPLGVELKNNVKRAWWKKFVQESPYNVGQDVATGDPHPQAPFEQLPRPRKLRILRFAASGKAHSLCCSSSPHATRFAGLAWGPLRAGCAFLRTLWNTAGSTPIVFLAMIFVRLRRG